MNESTSTNDKAGKYKDFNDWFNEIESYGMRAERFYDSLSQFSSVEAEMANLRLWLRAAFEAGRRSGN